MTPIAINLTRAGTVRELKLNELEWRHFSTVTRTELSELYVNPRPSVCVCGGGGLNTPLAVF